LTDYENRLDDHYRPLVEEHGHSFRAVNWGSKRGQQIRFQVLSEVGDLAKCSILDIGCGVGHFVEVLASMGFSGIYTGIDSIPEMVKMARVSYPEWNFELGNIVEGGNERNADYVLGSGLFNLSNEGVFKETVSAMFAACNVAVAFNSLSSWSNEKADDEFHADPLETMRFCRELTPWINLRHDYFSHDFTVYMFKDARI
jgi:SAM-dependent methyltransferase